MPMTRDPKALAERREASARAERERLKRIAGDAADRAAAKEEIREGLANLNNMTPEEIAADPAQTLYRLIAMVHDDFKLREES